MKNNVLLFFIFLTIAISCKTVSVFKGVAGHYFKKGKGLTYNLTLNEDSSFMLNQKYFDVDASCKGQWHYISTDTIALLCDKDDLTAQLQRGYMSEREMKVIVLSKKRLKLGKVILSKK